MNNVRFLYIRPTGYGQGYESSEQIEVVFEICPKLIKSKQLFSRASMDI